MARGRHIPRGATLIGFVGGTASDRTGWVRLCNRMNLRIDPWDSDFGASVELDPELGEPPDLDLEAETEGTWSPIASPVAASVPCCAFIDGVRRIDARMFAEADGVETPALAGSWAVGCAWSTRPPACGDEVVGRELVIGGGLAPVDLDVAIGVHALRFTGRSVPGNGPSDPLRGLQLGMRTAEGALAQGIVAAAAADLVVCDGPLSHYLDGPALGMIKRQARIYLDAERGRVIGQLRAGERTPIFRLGEEGYERFTWYLRLAPARPIDGAMAGVARLEVSTQAGLAAAQTLADLAGAVLPRFAPAPGRDARAPQNLYPIGALESSLRHRLGDAVLVRRAIEQRLHLEISHA